MLNETLSEDTFWRQVREDFRFQLTLRFGWAMHPKLAL